MKKSPKRPSAGRLGPRAYHKQLGHQCPRCGKTLPCLGTGCRRGRYYRCLDDCLALKLPWPEYAMSFLCRDFDDLHGQCEAQPKLKKDCRCWCHEIFREPDRQFRVWAPLEPARISGERVIYLVVPDFGTEKPDRPGIRSGFLVKPVGPAKRDRPLHSRSGLRKFKPKGKEPGGR